MSQFFASHEAARRYHAFRPKVHQIVLDWLSKHCGPQRWRRGLDVEEAVRNGSDYEQICNDLLPEVRALAPEGPFRYSYSYEIHRYNRRQQGHRANALPHDAPG